MKRINLNRCASLLAFFCWFAFAQTAFAQATLSIQGIIQKSNGAAVDDGKYDLTFKLYTSTSGGTAVHTETQNVSVAGGIYSAELGGGSTPLSAAFDQTYYLGVSVNGSAELVPRTRLTSSPYSLALLGTSNLFPGSGAIGAGTITPAAGYQMHLKSASAAGKLLIEGSTAANIDLKKGSTVGNIGFGTANNDFILNPGANNTVLQYSGSTKLTVNSNGVDIPGTFTAANFSPATMAITTRMAVGQAAVDNNYALKVNGQMQIASGGLDIGGWFNATSAGPHSFYTYNSSGNGGGFNADVSIRAAAAIHASIFRALSDRRIKKDLQASNAAADLSLLMRLNVTDYRYIDLVKNGNTLTKGFIAQEVEQVFPQAVNNSTDFIPNVYALSANTKFSAGKMTISLEKAHDFAVGDEVKLMLPDGEKKVIVAAVPSENAFLVNWDAPAADKIFVYGKQVNDLHTVDYDRIFTLNISATQELARKVALLEKENAALRSELGATKAENGQMKASVEKFDARLRALERSRMNEK